MSTFKPLLILGLLLLTQLASGQVLFPGHFHQDYQRLLDLQNYNPKRSITLNPAIATANLPNDSVGWDLWNNALSVVKNGSIGKIHVLNPVTSITYNTESNKGENDGAEWKGKGLNLSLNFGVTGRIGKFHYTLAPVVYYAQNREFAIPEGMSENEFAYPFSKRIDWVQRYGNSSLAEIHPGQSEIRFIHKKFTVGISTQNMSWGPSQINPIIMSNNAGGFPHLDIGTITPVDTKIGKVEFRTIWGAMSESDYFDEDSGNNRRYITGFVLGIEPKGLKGLHIGINRILYRSWRDGDLGVKDFFTGFANFHIINSDSTGRTIKNDEYDQILSTSARYTFHEVGFETYIEYARNDFPGNVLDFFEHPDRSAAYTLGFIKTFERPNGNIVKFVYERTTLSSNKISLLRGTGSPTYYVHPQVPQGYTNNGQVVGASIGPGSNSDYLQLNFYKPNSMLGFHFQRIRFNDDYFFSIYAGSLDFPTDYEVSLGVNYVRFVKNFTINPQITWVYRDNWYYDSSVQVDNFQLSLRLGYNINN